MLQADGELWRGQADLQKQKHDQRNSGLDLSVIYVTVKRLAEMAGKSRNAIFLALQSGKLTAARRGAGRSPVLIHPEEARRYLLAQEEKCSSN